MKILICGSTYFLDYEKLHDEVCRIITEKGYNQFPFGPFNPINITIISGVAKGADTLAVQFAKQYNLPCLEFPAEWDKYKKGAGPIRNQQMLDKGHPDLVIAFPMPGSRGTLDMINRSLFEGVEVIIIE